MKPKFANMADGTVRRRLCPTCETLCKIVLRFNAPTKRQNGLFWECGTLDCGFRERVKLERTPDP